MNREIMPRIRKNFLNSHKKLIRILKSKLFCVSVLLPLYFAVLLYASTPSEKNINVVIKTRKTTDNHQSLLIELTGGSDIELDEINIKLPKNTVQKSTPGCLPKGWDLKKFKNSLSLSGPNVGIPCYLRVDMGKSRPPQKLGLEILVDSYKQFQKKKFPVAQTNPVRVSDSFSDILKFPSIVTSGDYIEFVPLDFEKTPINGSWRVAGERAIKIDGKNRFGVNLPDSLKVGDPISVVYTDPYCTDMYKTKNLPGSRVMPSIEYGHKKPFITGVTSMVFPGDTICVRGYFPDVDSRNGLLLNGKPMPTNPLFSSTLTMVHRIPKDIKSRPHQISGNFLAGFDKSNQLYFKVIRIKGLIDRNKLLKGESTTLKLWVKGTEEPVQMELTNHTPEIISLDGGERQMIPTSGGKENVLEKMVHGITPGNFRISYKLQLDRCPDVSSSTVSRDAKRIKKKCNQITDLLTGGGDASCPDKDEGSARINSRIHAKMDAKKAAETALKEYECSVECPKVVQAGEITFVLGETKSGIKFEIIVGKWLFGHEIYWWAETPYTWYVYVMCVEE